MVYLYNGILYSNKKEWVTNDNINLDESNRHSFEPKKFWSVNIDKINQEDREQISGNHSCGGGWWIMIRKGYKETLWSAKKALYLGLVAGYMGIHIC